MRTLIWASPRTGEVVTLFGERPGRTLVLTAAPGPFAPDQSYWAPEAGHVDQLRFAAAVAVRYNAARAAARRLEGCLDDHGEDASAFGDVDDVEPVQADKKVAPIVGGHEKLPGDGYEAARWRT